MKKRPAKVLLALSMTMVLFGVSACGSSQGTGIEESSTTASVLESEESESVQITDETEQVQTAFGHQHYINVEAQMKEIADSEEKAWEEEEETEDSQEKPQDVAQFQGTNAVESAPVSSAPKEPESIAPAPEPAPSVNTDTVPDTITLNEWYPPTPMFVLYNTTVKDEPYAASGDQGRIERGSSIGVTGQCVETGYYRVNYGAKPAYLPGDALSLTDPYSN